MEEKLHNQELHIHQLESQVMQQNAQNNHSHHNRSGDIPTIYAITPTYYRSTQKAELTRLTQTFSHVTNFHWIIVEDAYNKSTLVTNLLAKSGLQYTQLNIGSPPQIKDNIAAQRGVIQRNKGLEWIHNKTNPQIHKGVVYFADDDNTYGLQLFEEVII